MRDDVLRAWWRALDRVTAPRGRWNTHQISGGLNQLHINMDTYLMVPSEATVESSGGKRELQLYQ